VSTATVVGGGPNGLAAAVALAREGVRVTVLEAAGEAGGGARSGESLVPGLLHDHCAAFHPMAAGSPFLNGLGLDRYGLSWRWAEIDCAHPLDGGDAGLLYRSVEDTAAGLGGDGARWRLVFGRPAATYDTLACDIMRPLLRAPSHPLALARFGLPTLLPGSSFARIFGTQKARALFGGVAAHAFRPLHYPLTSAIGAGIITAGHRWGWPVAAGGSGSITAALAALLACRAAPAGRRDAVRPRAGRGRFPAGRSAAPARGPGIAPLPARAGGVQGGLRGRGGRAVGQPGRGARGHRAPGRRFRGDRRHRAGDQRRAAA